MTKRAGTREVPISWEALEDAFENNAPEVHSYLHLENGEVVRIVDGIADPAMHQRIMSDPLYMRIDPVSSREQYRWMERFIATVDSEELARKLTHAIDGKGAFRRFKDVLLSHAVERERWFTFRSERLRACMEAWLTAHHIVPVERPAWPVPSADEVKDVADEKGDRRGAAVEAQRKRAQAALDRVPGRELDTAIAFLEFLSSRRPVPRTRVRRPPRSGEEE